MREKRKIGTVIMQVDNYAVAVDGVLAYIDSENKNVKPYVKDGRTFVPIRFISEFLNGNVTWDDGKKEVTIKLDDNTVVMCIGKNEYTHNGIVKTIEVSPEIVDGRIFAPVRFVAEAFEKSVYWDDSNKTVVIAPIDDPWDEKSKIEQDLLNDSLVIMSPFVRDFYNKNN